MQGCWYEDLAPDRAARPNLKSRRTVKVFPQRPSVQVVPGGVASAVVGPRRRTAPFGFMVQIAMEYPAQAEIVPRVQTASTGRRSGTGTDQRWA